MEPTRELNSLVDAPLPQQQSTSTSSSLDERLDVLEKTFDEPIDAGLSPAPTETSTSSSSTAHTPEPSTSTSTSPSLKSVDVDRREVHFKDAFMPDVDEDVMTDEVLKALDRATAAIEAAAVGVVNTANKVDSILETTPGGAPSYPKAQLGITRGFSLKHDHTLPQR